MHGIPGGRHARMGAAIIGRECLFAITVIAKQGTGRDFAV
jgi:hypothetical protein